MNFKKLFFLLAISFAGSSLWAQCETVKITSKADFAYSTNSFGAAIELYERALGKAKRDKQLKGCIYYKIAKCYLHLNNYKQATKNFKKALKNPPDVPIIYYEYGQLLKSEGRYEEAKVQFDLYSGKVPDDERGPIASKSCDDAIAFKQGPTCHKLENMKPWNTKGFDYCAVIAHKKNDEILFTSNGHKGIKSRVNDVWDAVPEDIYFTEKDRKGKWSTPVVQDMISTQFSEGSGKMNRRYNTLYFSRCFGDKKNGSGCRIYQCRQMGTKWKEPVQMTQLFPDSFVTVHPSVSRDGKYMIFASNYPEGSYGGMDLWIATYDKKQKTFVNPRNLGPKINSRYHEMYPYIKDDGTLFFSSDNPSGMGGLDIYLATMDPTTSGDLKKIAWNEPENMQYPMNSEADDFGIVYEYNKETGYITSNRKGGRGNDDIYSFSVPVAKIMLSGTVRDKDTKEVIPDATVTMQDAAGNKYTATSDATGFYKKEIPFGISYDMEASKKDYYNDWNRASTSDLDPLHVCNDTNIVADFYLKTQKVDLEFEIQFVFDKCFPFDEFGDTMDVMVQILTDNPTMVVEIGAHTDSRGTPEYNEKLSDCRAKAIVDSLIARGIDPKRLVAKGYGETQPRVLHKDFKGTESGMTFPKDTKLDDEYINALNDGTEGGKKKFEDAHRFNRRIHMHKLSDDYVPPKDPDDFDDDDDGSE